MERSICAHLIHIATGLTHLANCKVPLGVISDALIRLLIEYYICTTNITKHLIVRTGTLSVVYQQIKYDKLVQVSGKPLASRIYDLITYIDNNVLASSNEEEGEEEVVPKKRGKSDAKSNKQKVLKDTRFLPKLILWLENLNKFVIMLGRKTQIDISHYLHSGTVRDFRIKTDNLREAIRNRASIAQDEDEERVDEDQATDYEENVEEAEELQNSGANATEKIKKNLAKLKRKTKSSENAAKMARPKKRRQINVPDEAAQVLISVRENVPKSPAKKKARKAKK